jgi:hypothetical protein
VVLPSGIWSCAVVVESGFEGGGLIGRGGGVEAPENEHFRSLWRWLMGGDGGQGNQNETDHVFKA